MTWPQTRSFLVKKCSHSELVVTMQRHYFSLTIEHSVTFSLPRIACSGNERFPSFSPYKETRRVSTQQSSRNTEMFCMNWPPPQLPWTVSLPPAAYVPAICQASLFPGICKKTTVWPSLATSPLHWPMYVHYKTLILTAMRNSGSGNHWIWAGNMTQQLLLESKHSVHAL
jgi:hypothetical protein